MADWGPAISVIANIGFSAIVGWYLLTKAIPEMQAKFSKDMADQRKDFTTTLMDQRVAFDVAFQRERDNSKIIIDILVNQITDMTKKSSEKLDIILKRFEETSK